MNERNRQFIERLARFAENSGFDLRDIEIRYEDGLSFCLWWQEETGTIETIETTPDDVWERVYKQ